MSGTRSGAIGAMVAVALGGCATTSPSAITPPRAREIGRTSEVIVAIAQDGDTPASLAQRYLNDAGQARRVYPLGDGAKPDGAFRAGDAVAIPLRPVDPQGARDTDVRVPILCYHRFIAQAGHGSKMEVSAASFEAQLRYLRDHGYEVIPLGRLKAFLDGTADLPPKPVVLTIDDGYRSAYTIALPLLRKYGAQATLFVYSDFIGSGEALSWPQIADLEASGVVDVEAHSKTHSDLTKHPPRETPAAFQRRLEIEFSQPRDLIAARTGARPTIFAYPYGAADGSVADFARRSGWSLGLTVIRGSNPPWADPLLLRRDMVFGSDGLDTFAKRLAAVDGSGRRP